MAAAVVAVAHEAGTAPRRRALGGCCTETEARCLSCELGQSLADFCAVNGHMIGCAGLQVSTTSGPGLASTEQTGDSLKHWDCHAGNHWSKEKKQWCCQNMAVGCAPRFDCTAIDFADDVQMHAGFSQEERSWCCEHERLGCRTDGGGGKEAAADSEEAPGAGTTEAHSTASVAQTTTLPAPATVTSTSATITERPTTLGVTAIPAFLPGATGDSDEDFEAVSWDDNKPSLRCFEDKVTWEPLDMASARSPVKASSTSECQKQCESTTGCRHFSFWTPGSLCHMQDSFAARQEGRIGYVSGPFKCWSALNHSQYVRISPGAYVTKDLRCIELGAVYSPILGMPKFLSRYKDPVAAVKECEALCQGGEGCAHWSLQGPQNLCRLATASAQKLSELHTVSGPRVCPEMGPNSGGVVLSEAGATVGAEAAHDVGAVAFVGPLGAILLLAGMCAALRHGREAQSPGARDRSGSRQIRLGTCARDASGSGDIAELSALAHAQLGHDPGGAEEGRGQDGSTEWRRIALVQ